MKDRLKQDIKMGFRNCFFLGVVIAIISTATRACPEPRVVSSDVSLPERAFVKVTRDPSLSISIGIKNLTGRIMIDCLNSTQCKISCNDDQPPNVGDESWKRATMELSLGENVTSANVERCLIYSEPGLQILTHVLRRFRSCQFFNYPRSVIEVESLG